MDVGIHGKSKLNKGLELDGAAVSEWHDGRFIGVCTVRLFAGQKERTAVAPKPRGQIRKIIVERRHTGGSPDFSWRSNKPECLSPSTVSMSTKLSHNTILSYI